MHKLLRFIRTILLAVVTTSSMLLADTASSQSKDYSAFGFSDDDLHRFEDYKRSINSCGAAFIAEPDVSSPKMSKPLMTMSLVAHQMCRKKLKAENASIGVIRVEDFDRSLLCLAYSMMFPDDETVGEHQACNQPSALPAPVH